MSEIRGHGDRGGYPSVAERVIRVIRDVAVIFTLTLLCLLILSAMQAANDLADRLDQLRSPEPIVTECIGETC